MGATVGAGLATVTVPTLRWRDDSTLDIGDVSFLVTWDPERWEDSTGERFTLIKARPMIDRYAALAASLAPRRIFELGTWQGGSTVLFHHLYRPQRIVSLDWRSAPKALCEYIARHGLASEIRLHTGVNQADAGALTRIVSDEFCNEPLDLVIDDASHLLQETTASFNTLFPRLRPGGIYVIEDWGWAHWPGVWQTAESAYALSAALTTLVFQLVMVSASRPDVVAEVVVSKDLVLVTRGQAPLDAGLDISASYLVSDPGTFAPLFRPSTEASPDQVTIHLAARLAAIRRRYPRLFAALRPVGALIARHRRDRTRSEPKVGPGH
jgi:predicted O-methyltransferase YrrM